MSEIKISTDVSSLDIELIYSEIKNSYWAKGISKKIFVKSLKNSICFGVYKGDSQIGFARVVTDNATFAYLGDVFIVQAERGKGYSKKLMEFILKHKELQGLRRFCLGTRDAQALYKRYGFKELEEPKNWLEIKNSKGYL